MSLLLSLNYTVPTPIFKLPCPYFYPETILSLLLSQNYPAPTAIPKLRSPYSYP